MVTFAPYFKNQAKRQRSTMKKFFNLFDLKQKVNYKNEVLSGLTVAIALVPEAIAFALLAGLSPITGLYAAFSIGLITSILGGRPGMISGATGAIAVVFIGMIVELNEKLDVSGDEVVQYIFATVILAGVIQMLIGFLRLGKFIRLVPHSVMYGFVNGLAIVTSPNSFPVNWIMKDLSIFYHLLPSSILFIRR